MACSIPSVNVRRLSNVDTILELRFMREEPFAALFLVQNVFQLVAVSRSSSLCGHYLSSRSEPSLLPARHNGNGSHVRVGLNGRRTNHNYVNEKGIVNLFMKLH